MNRHRPTRIDIRTQGWTSGLDIPPLPRECQTALCIHQEHQLRGTVRKDADELIAAFSAQNVQEAEEASNRGWVAPSDLFTDLPGADMPLDLPTVSIRRGGLRYPPVGVPSASFHIIRSGLHWQIEVRHHGTQTWHKPAALRFWRRKRAENVRAWIMSHQENIREEYVNRVNAR